MVLSRGENRILISDSSKFGKTALIKVCDFKDINRLITDGIPDDKLSAALQAAGVMRKCRRALNKRRRAAMNYRQKQISLLTKTHGIDQTAVGTQKR
jgi:hypothetical protein